MSSDAAGQQGAPSVSPQAAGPTDAIRPGRLWLDTEGKRIQAHGGSVYHEDGVFYWYGENKERTIPGAGIWHWGVRCYSSTDLVNWEDRGIIIPPEPDDPSSPLHPAAGMDRPHIIKHPHTGKYVCFVKVMELEGHGQRTTVLVADDFLGPYEIVNRSFRPLGMNAGDFDLVVDDSDGKGYYVYERVHSELIIADLTDDFTDVTGYYSTHFPHPAPPAVREAPAYFRRGAEHFLITSGTTGYFPNRSEIAMAPSIHGPWTVLGDPHPDDDSHTSFRSQVSCVFKHPGKKDLYIAMADRWIPELDARQSNVGALFERYFSGEDFSDPTALAEIDPAVLRHIDIANTDTSVADYVWLPIVFEGSQPVIRWLDEWRVDDFD